MRSEKQKESLVFRFFYLLLFIFHFSLLISLSACGKRGDPAAIMPYEDKTVVKDINKTEENRKDSAGEVIEKNETEIKEDEFAVPDSPSGLDVLYTRTSVILTWDEIIGQGVRSYRIYRSKGDDFVLVGNSMAPVFTDMDIERNVRYIYRITAFGASESLPSKEIGITTEVH